MKHRFSGGPLARQVLVGGGPRTIDVAGRDDGRYIRKFVDVKFGVAVYLWHQVREQKKCN